MTFYVETGCSVQGNFSSKLTDRHDLSNELYSRTPKTLPRQLPAKMLAATNSREGPPCRTVRGQCGGVRGRRIDEHHSDCTSCFAWIFCTIYLTRKKTNKSAYRRRGPRRVPVAKVIMSMTTAVWFRWATLVLLNFWQWELRIFVSTKRMIPSGYLLRNSLRSLTCESTFTTLISIEVARSFMLQCMGAFTTTTNDSQMPRLSEAQPNIEGTILTHKSKTSTQIVCIFTSAFLHLNTNQRAMRLRNDKLVEIVLNTDRKRQDLHGPSSRTDNKCAAHFF